MAAYLLTWNPKRYHFEELPNWSKKVKKGKTMEFSWSCGRRQQIQVGDQVFLIRLGEEPKGIVASGRVTEGSYQDRHWDRDKARDGKTAWYVNAKYHVLLDPEKDTILSLDRLNKPPFVGVNWTSQTSGIGIPDKTAMELEKALTNISGTNPVDGETTNSFTNFPLNIIFYGPPGTGKTFNTVNYALAIVENKFLETIDDEQKELGRKALIERFNDYRNSGVIEFITFHQNYSYEDFIQGLRPDTKNDSGTLKFKLVDGVFKRIIDKILNKPQIDIGLRFKAERAGYTVISISDEIISLRKDSDGKILPIPMNLINELVEAIKEGKIGLEEVRNREDSDGNHIADKINSKFDRYLFGYNRILYQICKYIMERNNGVKSDQNYVIIIDEINRANISRVFGELITLIEPDKRIGEENAMVATLPSGEEFAVPPNLYIIGTMNTADKSIALLDIALRRRFEFIKIYPNSELDNVEYKDLLNKLNQEIIKEKGPDFQIGHSYFMADKNGYFNLEETMNKKVIPLLYEYFMNSGDKVKSILENVGIKIRNEMVPCEFESYESNNE